MSDFIEQACAIPYRTRDDGQYEFCLITSIKNGYWGFPKGVVDPGETWYETALKEAREEAGLEGRIVGRPLGAYDDFKWSRKLNVMVLLMEVWICHEQWEEQDSRKRQWAVGERALGRLYRPTHKDFLQVALDALKEGNIHG